MPGPEGKSMRNLTLARRDLSESKHIRKVPIMQQKQNFLQTKIIPYYLASVSLHGWLH